METTKNLFKKLNLDLSRTPLRKMNGKKKINKAFDHIKLDTGDIPRLNSMISYGQVQTMEADLKPVTNDYFGGVKFHYGVMNDRFVLVYEPVLFEKIKDLNVKKNFCSFKELPGPKGYTFDDKGNMNTGNIDIKQCKKDFKNRIRIDHFDNDVFEEMIEDVDSEYALFSFQEIYDLMKHNNVEKIWVYNAAISNKNDPYVDIRQSVVLSSEKLFFWPRLDAAPAPKNEIYKSRFANLAHLCPPHRDNAFKIK